MLNQQQLQHLLNQVEAILFCSQQAVSSKTLIEVLSPSADGEVLGRNDLLNMMQLLNERYAATALQVVEVHGGWRVQVKNNYAGLIARVWPDKPLKLSQALLETLAIIAYQQPVTRADIEHIRGVAVNPHILRTLFDRDWICERGHREVPGKPLLLHTTPQFLESFGLKALNQLPNKHEFELTMQQMFEGTMVKS